MRHTEVEKPRAIDAARLRIEMNEAPSQSAEIGLFDSGVGGLTVLHELRRLMPQARLRYLADTAHAPYGERSPDDICALSLDAAGWLIGRGAQLIVVACNTATAHAIDALRARWPETPFVGTEPGIKPAVAASRNGCIGVLTTPATAASARYQALLARHAGAVEVFSQACPGMADLIEAGDLGSSALLDLIEKACAPLRAAGVDTVLLGCTHYPLVQPHIQAALGPDVQLLNIETAVALRAADLWRARPQWVAEQPALWLHASGASMPLQLMARNLFGSLAPDVTPRSS